jgi:hypothetical protein
MHIALETRRLRANPAYRVVAWNRLSPGMRKDIGAATDSYGVLLPVDGQSLPVVAIDNDMALLFLSLQEPGPAPGFAYSGRDAEAALHRLIFDSILQLEHGDIFISGPEACARLGVRDAGQGDGLARVSIEALAYGSALAHIDGATLAQKLYTYNTRPTTPTLQRRLPDRETCLAFLGLTPGSDARNMIDRLWTNGDDASPWLTFSRAQQQPEQAAQPCKLYVGLTFEELAKCLPAIAGAFNRNGASQFKVGTDLDGLLRPDKFVAYFPNKDFLLAAARDLLPIVADRAIHVVPFTAGITASGALSWGMDPENTWFGDRESWRQWICEKLAAALIAARNSTAETVAPWQFALERLRLEGVDTDTFMPTGSWSGAT